MNKSIADDYLSVLQAISFDVYRSRSILHLFNSDEHTYISYKGINCTRATLRKRRLKNNVDSDYYCTVEAKGGLVAFSVVRHLLARGSKIMRSMCATVCHDIFLTRSSLQLVQVIEQKKYYTHLDNYSDAIVSLSVASDDDGDLQYPKNTVVDPYFYVGLVDKYTYYLAVCQNFVDHDTWKCSHQAVDIRRRCHDLGIARVPIILDRVSDTD